MKITFGQGIENILFGLNETEVVNRLGKPDKVTIDEYGNRELFFNSYKLVLKIEIENQNRLGWIEVHNSQAEFENINPWATEKNVLINLLCSQVTNSYEFEDYGFMESYFFPNYWLELQFEFNELVSINFGVIYDENYKPIWP
jgi:hypothetical protein